MRKPLFSLGLVVLVAGACSSSAGPAGSYAPAPPAHHYPTAAPAVPASTPYDTTTFTDPGVNPPVDPAIDRLSTFGLDVDTASYTVARRFIADGHLPDPASVRVEEYVNYFDQEWPSPDEGVFAIYADGGPSPFLEPDETLVRIGLKARDESDRSRPESSLTFVIDVSGSMAREDRLELVKRSLRLLVDGLRPEDRVAIVVFGSEARVLLEPKSARHGETILDAIDSLQPEGSTNAAAGLSLGYEIARQQYREGGINRVILASDGVANVGLTNAEGILSRIRSDAETGIQLVTVGFGMGNFNDTLLEQLADKGDGFYAYVDDIDEARRLFVDNLTSTLHTVALDARVQVEFDPASVERYRLIGFENRAITDRNFRNEKVDAGAIGAGHAVTALYAVRLTGEGIEQGRAGTVNLRWIDPDSRHAVELRRDIRLADFAASFRSTAPTFQLDALVAAMAERFRLSEYGREYRLGDVVAEAEAVSSNLPQTDEVHGFLDLLHSAARLER